MTSPSVDYVWPLQPVTSMRSGVINVRIKVQPTRRGTHSSLPSQHPRSMASKLYGPITLRGDTQRAHVGEVSRVFASNVRHAFRFVSKY